MVIMAATFLETLLVGGDRPGCSMTCDMSYSVTYCRCSVVTFTTQFTTQHWRPAVLVNIYNEKSQYYFHYHYDIIKIIKI